MKEFIYTCEHCGTEYKISEYGQYKCQKCNNTFVVKEEDPFSPTEEEINEIEKRIQFQEQEKKLQDIQKKAEELQKKEAQSTEIPMAIPIIPQPQMQKKKYVYFGENASAILFVVFIFSLIGNGLAFLSMMVSDSTYGTIILFFSISNTVIIYTLFKFFGLFQRMEHHLRTLSKEDLDE